MAWRAVIVFGDLLGPLFLMLGLSQTAAASGSLLLNLPGLATMAIAWVFFRENVDRRVSPVLFMLGLRHLGTARTGAYFSLALFIGAVLAVIIFRDAVTIQLLLAGLLMGIGIWLHLSERHDHEHVHKPLEHEHSHIHDEHHHEHDGPVSEPHLHWHLHEPMRRRHPHYPDLHHRHSHG
jgi:drug/metabolite transporter (DMT)-like permease